jgi:hypothetical protein
MTYNPGNRICHICGTAFWGAGTKCNPCRTPIRTCPECHKTYKETNLICRTCRTGANPYRNMDLTATAEIAFRDRLLKLGAKPLYEVWQGVNAPHKVMCVNGHIRFPYPGNVQQGRGICNIDNCRSDLQRAHNDRLWQTAKDNFETNLAAVGARLLEAGYLGATVQHKVLCVNGHICYPQPTQLRYEGICKCCNQFWDAFYIVGNSKVLKIGITSQWELRQRRHFLDGLNETILICENLPSDRARFMEQNCLIQLKDEGHIPVKGYEYFKRDVLTSILSIIEGIYR